MPITRRILLTGIFIAMCFCSFAQQDTKGINNQNQADTFNNRLKASLVSYFKKYPQEKAFMHTNQQVYTTGETIWYKIYALAYGKPSALSKIVYVQLTDTGGNLIKQNKLPLLDGKAHGNIDIGQNLKTGWYKLSAFTSWMMNFDYEARFTQKIYIHNAADRIATSAYSEPEKKIYHINFYPEGGDLVDGTLTNVAFKAYSDDGLPASVYGVVNDNNNKTIEKFTATHDGMGEFTIEPVAGNSYTAAVIFPDGSHLSVNLPAVKSVGMCLQAGQNLNKIQLSIAFSGPKEKFENCVLAACQNSGQVNTYPLQLANGANKLEMPKAIFSTGILRLTLFDHDGLPQAERLLFINKHDLETGGLKTDTLSFLHHMPNAFSMIVKDEEGLPVNGNFSVAVTDGDVFKDEVAPDIFSGLLLTPELKGEVNNPGYYFRNESDSLARQLDLVMLTNGWRHFSWKKVLNNENYPFQHPAEQSQFMAGRVINYKDITVDKGQFNFRVLIMNQDSTKFLGYVTPDSTGSFIMKDFNHTGMSDIYLQTMDKKSHSKNLQVKLFTTLDDSLKQTKGIPFTGSTFPGFSGYYASLAENEANYRLPANATMLNTVHIREKKITPVEKLISEHVSPKYASNREYTLDLVNNPIINISLIDYIKGKFTNLQITGDNNSPAFIYRGVNTLKSPQPPLSGFQAEMASDQENGFLPYFYLNEAPVQFVSIKDISLTDVALIRYMPPPVGFAPYNGGNAGAIMIYTKKQSDEVNKMGNMTNFDHYIFNGYSITREFSLPDYNKIKQAGLLDDRVTLYWNHDLNTDANGVLKFNFYNSDVAKKYKVIIQGMDTQGRLLYLQQVVQ